MYTGNIYKFENKINGKIYIGQSREIKRRYDRHVNCKKPKYELEKAIKKYGIENFNYTILETFTSEILEEVNKWMDDKEDYYISFYNSVAPNGYNLLSSRHHPQFSDITKKRISEACSGEKNGFYGKKHSEETKEKMRQSAAKRDNTNIGKHKRTPEEIEKWKEMIKKYKESLTEEEKQNILKKQAESMRLRKINMGEEEYNEWNNKRIEKQKLTLHEKIKNGNFTTLEGRRVINNGIISKKVFAEELEKYLNLGWSFGYIKKRK